MLTILKIYNRLGGVFLLVLMELEVYGVVVQYPLMVLEAPTLWIM